MAKKTKAFKPKAAFAHVEEFGFRKSSKYITDGHFLMPFTFEEIADEKCDAIIPKIVDLTVKIFNTNIYLKDADTWFVLFADVLHNYVLFDKKYIDPFGITELMATSASKACALVEEGEIKYIVMPVRPELLSISFPKIYEVYSPLGKEAEA